MRSTLFVIGVLTFAACCQLLTGQSADTSQVSDLASKIVKSHLAWGPQLNSPGSSLTLKETSRQGRTVAYRLYETGLPRDQIYAIVQWPVTQSEPGVMLDGVTFNDGGLAICAGRPGTCGDPAKPDDPIDLIFPTPVKGEPFRLGVGSDADPKIRAVLTVVPIPNEADNNGCHLDAVLLMPHAELLLIEGSHFPPNTDLTLTGDSEGEVRRFKEKTDGDGRYSKAILPAKAGLESGTIKVRLEAEGCSVQLYVPWGVAGN